MIFGMEFLTAVKFNKINKDPRKQFRQHWHSYIIGRFLTTKRTLSRLRLSPGVKLFSGLLLLTWMVKPRNPWIRRVENDRALGLHCARIADLTAHLHPGPADSRQFRRAAAPFKYFHNLIKFV